MRRLRPHALGLVDRLRSEVSDVEDEGRRITLANELLMDIDSALDQYHGVPKKLAWIAMLVGLGAAAGYLLFGPRDSGAFACAAAGGIGAAACVSIERLLAARVTDVRAAVDNGVKEIVGDLYDAAIVLPSRRTMRWQRRRGA